MASLSETHVFSPSILNKATFGFSRGAFYFNSGVTGTASSVTGAWVDTTGVDVPGAVVIGGGTTLNGASALTNGGTNAGSNLTAVRNLFTWADQISITHGKHLISFGVWFERLQANDNLIQDQYGQASFNNLQTFLQGAISTYTFASSSTPLSWRSLEGAFYAEDAIKLTPSLELRLGFRGEFTNGWNEAYGRASNYLFTNGVINTNPTVGNSALSVNNAQLPPGAARGYRMVALRLEENRDPRGRRHLLRADRQSQLPPGSEWPFNTVEASKKATVAEIEGTGTLPTPLVIPSGVQPNLQTPTVISYDLKIEQQILPNTTLSVGYIGSHGYHEILSIDANVPSNVVICPASPCPANYPSGAYFYYASLATPLTGTPALANPAVANTTHWFSEGVSSYNGLEVDVNHQFSHGLQFRGVYTYSKALDDGDSMNTSVATNSPAFVSNPLNPLQADYGRASFDVRNAAVINATYDLPFGRKNASGDNRWWNTAIGNWQAQRNRNAGVRFALYAATFLQPIERWRLAQSCPAVPESGLYRVRSSRAAQGNISTRTRSSSRWQTRTATRRAISCKVPALRQPIFPWPKSSCSRSGSIFSSGPSFSIFSIAPTSIIRTRSSSLRRRRCCPLPRQASLPRLPPARVKYSLG